MLRRASMTLVAMLALSLPLAGWAELRKFELTIEEVEVEVAPGFKAKVWAYNGQVPGPLIRVNEGDEVELNVHHFTTQNHTIHWHHIDQDNDWQASDGA